jgi:large subunit ribosomal protein L9
MVVEATQGNITKAKEQKKAQEIREQRERQEAQALAEKISQATLLLKAKAAEDGRLYGSVTSKDISQALEEQKKIKVDKRKINLAEPIRYIGEIQVEIKILPGIIGNLRVKVERE